METEITKVKSKKLRFNIIVILLMILSISLGAFVGKTYFSKTEIKVTKKVEKEKEACISQNEEYKKKILHLEDKIKKLNSWKNKKSFVIINRELLKANLDYYTKLSPKIRSIILENVITEANRYNINPIILYSLLHVESTMRFQIQHSLVTIKIGKKRLKVRAVGLGGVVWEWWDEQLKKEGIAQTRSDLFLPDVNIKAVAYILNEMYKKPMLKGCKSQDESMLRRYFGGNFKSYYEKIDKKVMSIVRPNLYRY